MTCQIKHLSEEVCPNTIIFSTSIDAWTPAQTVKINFTSNSLRYKWHILTFSQGTACPVPHKFIHLYLRIAAPKEAA